jgi:hypothetical protein
LGIVSVTWPALAVSVFLLNDSPLDSTAETERSLPPPEEDEEEDDVLGGGAAGVDVEDEFELEPQALSATAPIARTAQLA